MSVRRVSVIMPTFNRRQTLEKALAAWDRQIVEKVELELVVVDDGSDDGTGSLLDELAPHHYRLQVARQSNLGPAAARNRGLSLASGELIFFTGDDIVPRTGLLQEHLTAHRELDAAGSAVVGHTGWPAGFPTTTTMRHVDGIGAQQFSYRYMVDGAEYDFRHFYTSNVSVRREVLDREPAGFSTDFRRAAFEDAEYSYRLSFHGMRIFYRAAASADHHHYYDVASFFRRQVACGEMAAVLYDKHPELRKWLSISELEWLALELRRSSAECETADGWEIEEAESRLLRLARYFDDAELAPIHPLLLAVFRYGYLKGLVLAAFADEAPGLLRSAFLRSVTPAVLGFANAMRHYGVEPVAADLDHLLDLR